MKLKNKVALVTGAGTGIGQGIAIELARNGAKIAIHYNSSDTGAKQTEQYIKELGGESYLVKANVSQKDQVDKMIKAVANHFGVIDILINNAALQKNIGLMDYDDAAYDLMMDINLKGYWQCIQGVIPYMKQNKHGRIINVSSIHGKKPTQFDPVYSMTKGAIKMLTREAALELGRYGITVNSIEPGYIEVGVKSGHTAKKGKDPSLTSPMIGKPEERLPKGNPLGILGVPYDIGALVCHMASDENEIMTGASIRLDNGTLLA